MEPPARQMRYTCFRTTVSKVFDRVLDKEETQSVIRSLKDKDLTCSIQIKSGPVHESVRILELTDNDVTWRLIKSGGYLTKTSDIADITAIEVYTNEELMVALKPEPTRWSTLDASDS